MTQLMMAWWRSWNSRVTYAFPPIHFKNSSGSSRRRQQQRMTLRVCAGNHSWLGMVLIHPEIAWPSTRDHSGYVHIYRYCTIARYDLRIMFTFYWYIYIYIQRSATERITALYEEDRKPGVGLTLVPNLRKVRACSPNIFFLFQNESWFGCTGMSTRELSFVVLASTVTAVLPIQDIDTKEWTWDYGNSSFSSDDG